MADFDFSTLSSSDFEELSCDLMNIKESVNPDSTVRYKTFKDGRDKGIDFLYSSEENEFDHIGQVKHYYRSGFEGLLRTFTHAEAKKIKVLNPNKYFVFTSVDLSVANTESIKSACAPFIKTLNDIFGKKDINKLIEDFPAILDIHFKLWFSDTTVFQKILKSGLEFRSAHFIKHEIERRICLYVKTHNFNSIRDTLKETKSVIITGEPGVGKTMLAEMLCYEFIKDDYRLHYLARVTEFEDLIQPDDSKQIFYFDDFLGSNKVEINKAKESETDLTRILKRISRLENKYFVFTTRNFLFNTAIDESENLKRLNIKSKEQIFNLNEYSSDLKKKILINHIDYSTLDDTYKEILTDPYIFKFLHEHQNFSPRSIEFITNEEVISEIPAGEFKQFILENFDNPSRIWEHAYKQQIYEDDKILLNTLFSFGEYATMTQLEKAFYTRLEFEAKTNNKKNESDAFNSSVKRLFGGFIIERNGRVEFINPSIIDFLQNYLITNLTEVTRIAESVCFTKQLTERLFLLSHKFPARQDIVPDSLKKKLLRDYRSFLNDNRDLDLMRIALVIFKYVKEDDYLEVVEDIIYQIENWKDLYDDYEMNLCFREFLQITLYIEPITKAIKERVTEFAVDLIKGERDLFMSVEVLDKLIYQYNISIEHIDKHEIENHINDLLNEYIYDEFDSLEDYISDESQATEIIVKLDELIETLEKIGLKVNSNLEEYKEIDWFELAINNDLKRMMEKDD